MIYDTLAHRAVYASTHPGLSKALTFLASADFSAIPDGRVEIDGDRIFANVMTYTTKAGNDTPELHYF